MTVITEAPSRVIMSARGLEFWFGTTHALR